MQFVMACSGCKVLTTYSSGRLRRSLIPVLAFKGNMSQPESHQIRNGIITTVVGGLILAGLGYAWTPARLVLSWLWSLVTTVWGWLVASYHVPGWLLLVCGFFAAAFLIRVTSIYLRNSFPTPPYQSYTSDTMFGAHWHWSWNDNQIIKLWASCPSCQGELVYLNNPDNYLMSVPRAKFFCEHCQQVLVDISGGEREYAMAAVEREIRRRLRIANVQAAEAAS